MISHFTMQQELYEALREVRRQVSRLTSLSTTSSSSRIREAASASLDILNPMLDALNADSDLLGDKNLTMIDRMEAIDNLIASNSLSINYVRAHNAVLDLLTGKMGTIRNLLDDLVLY